MWLKKNNLHSQVHNRIIHNSKEKKTTSVSMMDKWIRMLWHTHILCVCVCVYRYIKNSVQFSCSVVSYSLGPYGMQHARLSCPSPTTELAQTHVHWVSDAIQPSHPLSSPSPPAFNLSQYQGLFKWVGSLHQVAKELEFQLQHQSFQWIFRTYFL